MVSIPRNHPDTAAPGTPHNSERGSAWYLLVLTVLIAILINLILHSFVPNTLHTQYCCMSSTSTPQRPLLLQLHGPKPHLQPCRAGLISAMPQDSFPEHPLQELEEPACLVWHRASAGFAFMHPTPQMPQPRRGLQAHPPLGTPRVQNPPRVGGSHHTKEAWLSVSLL